MPGDGVELRPVLLLGGGTIEGVGPGFHEVAMRPLQVDRHEDVTDLDRVAAGNVHANQVVAELRLHRRGELTGPQPFHSVEERLDEAARIGVDPPEVAAACGAPRVGRLRLGHGVELLAALQARPQGADPRQGRRGVARLGEAWLGDETQICDGRPLELVLVLREVAPRLGFGHGGRAVGNLPGGHRHDRHRHRVVRVPIHPPQMRVGDVHVGGEELQELHVGDFVAVALLQREQELGVAAPGHELLPLLHVEAAVHLEFGEAGHFRRRAGERRLADFIVADCDPQFAVRLVQQHGLDHLVGDAILELLLVFLGELPARLAPRLVIGRLIRLLPLGVMHFLPVDLQHHVAGRPGRATGDPRANVEDEPAKEGDGQHVEHVLRHFPHGAHHGRGAPSQRMGRGISLYATTSNLKRRRCRKI